MPTFEDTERRVKSVLISIEDVVRFKVAPQGLVHCAVRCDIPKDASIVGIISARADGMIQAIVTHPSFPPHVEGQPLPLLEGTVYRSEFIPPPVNGENGEDIKIQTE